MGRCLRGDLKCSETSLPKDTGSRKSDRTFAKKNSVAIPKKHNPAGYDASPSVRKMENKQKNTVGLIQILDQSPP